MRSHAFTLYCFAAFFIYLGYYSCERVGVPALSAFTAADMLFFDTVTTFVAASAINIGVSSTFSFYLVSICNACSGMSRITSGLTADKTGTYKM